MRGCGINSIALNKPTYQILASYEAWWVGLVCKPILVLSFGLSQAEQQAGIEPGLNHSETVIIELTMFKT